MDKLIDLLGKFVVGKFYGKLTINFQNGKIVNIVKEESIKLD